MITKGSPQDEDDYCVSCTTGNSASFMERSGVAQTLRKTEKFALKSLRLFTSIRTFSLLSSPLPPLALF